MMLYLYPPLSSNLNEWHNKEEDVFPTALTENVEKFIRVLNLPVRCHYQALYVTMSLFPTS